MKCLRKRARRGAEEGFTLAEILVVVVIIGILAAFVLPKFFGTADEARITACRAQIQALVGALRMYKMEHRKFPPTDEGLEALLDKNEAGKLKYLEIPKLPKDPWDNDYQYMNPGEKGGDYDLWSGGPDGVSGTEDDIGNWQ